MTRYQFQLNRNGRMFEVEAERATEAFTAANRYFDPTAYGPGVWMEIGQETAGVRCFYWARGY